MDYEEIRLGGMALPNGVLVHGPHTMGLRDPERMTRHPSHPDRVGRGTPFQ